MTTDRSVQPAVRPAAKIWLNRILGGLAAVILFAMMVLTFVDVIGRYFFNTPVEGGFEITELMLATLIFAGLPLVSATDGHIAVDIFEILIPNAVSRIKEALINLACAAMTGVLAWQLAIKTGETVGYGDVTAILHIPIWPVVAFMTATLVATALILVIRAGVVLFPRNR
ncbi:TRAP transporter small permease [Oceanibacterium hippocampi]|uniref:TRAP transporter small permease protein n=1 Tax=Oceanibacterium hippocampi TaxID=745714 RepID=A0A1Y5RYY7_9PROT|nr:TRAP transporter small permease [Oceanibacterium hippocampi]SLN28908.1 2,3-diketo-L-gulonate TRAP transporter small permease protein YiaM [Oceanibacterium hippocampi]